MKQLSNSVPQVYQNTEIPYTTAKLFCAKTIFATCMASTMFSCISWLSERLRTQVTVVWSNTIMTSQVLGDICPMTNKVHLGLVRPTYPILGRLGWGAGRCGVWSKFCYL